MKRYMPVQLRGRLLRPRYVDALHELGFVCLFNENQMPGTVTLTCHVE